MKRVKNSGPKMLPCFIKANHYFVAIFKHSSIIPHPALTRNKDNIFDVFDINVFYLHLLLY